MIPSCTASPRLSGGRSSGVHGGHLPQAGSSDEDAMQLALEFYGPMYLLYSVYDGAEKKESASSLLATHIDHFIAKVESDYRKKGRTT